jgi:recombinational DNA repair protein (RecF pathway)
MKTLELLEQDFSSLTLLLIILANVIKESGYCLNYSSCVCCGSKKQIVSLSFNQGGYLCLKCVQNQAELRSEEYLNTYRYLFLVKAEQMDKHLIPQGIGLRLLKELFAYLIKVEELPNFKSLEVYLKAIETK